MSNEPENSVPPLKKSEEIALAAARGLISELPGGGLLLELLPVVAPERLKRFFRTTEDDLTKLIASGKVSLEDLTHNENFFSVLLSAATIAVRNHQEEKLEMLRNAVLNAALPDAPEDDIQAMYLVYVDRLTPWHVRILRFLDKPQSQRLYFANISSALEGEFPDLMGKSDFYMPILGELEELNLIGNTLAGVQFTKFANEKSESDSYSTIWGRAFLRYLDSPLHQASVTE